MSRIALVTGASRGIGAATARLAAAAGYDVAVNYVANCEAAKAVAAQPPSPLSSVTAQKGGSFPSCG